MIDDLKYMCQIYQITHRDKEILESLKELIDINPQLDKNGRVLFQAGYKQIIDSMRDSLGYLTQYLDMESGLGHNEMAKAIQDRKDTIVEQLILMCKEAITTIDQSLLPACSDDKSYIFFIKYKADLYRYISEYSDDTDSVSAANQAEQLYRKALDMGETALVKTEPTWLSLILNAAVFQYEIRHNVELATEMLEKAISDCDSSFQDLSPDEQKESANLNIIMRTNLTNWGLVEEDIPE